MHKFFFDRAVISFGIAFEADIDNFTKKAKNDTERETKRIQRTAVWLMDDRMGYRSPVL